MSLEIELKMQKLYKTIPPVRVIFFTINTEKRKNGTNETSFLGLTPIIRARE